MMHSFSINFEATTTSRAIWQVEKLRLTTSNTFTAYECTYMPQTANFKDQLLDVRSWFENENL